MKARAGISRRFVIVIASIVSALVLILAVAFNQVLRGNHAIITKTIVDNRERLLLQKAEALARAASRRGTAKASALAAELKSLCLAETDCMGAVIFTRTADENYFRAAETIILNPAADAGIAKDAVVREDRESGYLKKGLFEPAVDPLVRASKGVYWQNAYVPFTLGKKEVVLQFLFSATAFQTALDGYSGEISRMKKIVALLAIALVLAVFGASYLFMHNFTLLIDGLASSMKKASVGELDVNLNAGADEELMELATSFNSLVGGLRELKAREKIFEEKEKILADLENKDTLGDIFKFGVTLLKENRLEDAAALFTTLTFLKPEGFGSYFNLGVIYARRKDYAKSMDMFQRALQANPGNELTMQYIEKIRKLQYGDETTGNRSPA